MRRLVWLVALVAFKAFGTVEIPNARVESVAPDRVFRSCDGASSQGCTKFVEAALLCECRLETDGWRLHATARAKPLVYISDIKWLRHEMTHIWDFRFFLRQHLSSLAERRFATPKECDDFAQTINDAFPETMQRIARISADRRDGTYQATSEDHLVVMKAEVVAELVNDRLSDLADDVPTTVRYAQNRTSKDRDLIGKRGQHVKASLRQGDAAVNAKKLVFLRVIPKDVAVFVSRLFFDDHNDVVEQPRKLVRQLIESLFDELLEFQGV